MPDSKSILILSPDVHSRENIAASVRKFNLDEHCCRGYLEARNLLKKHKFDVVLCSDALADANYADVISAAKPVPVVVFSRQADWGPFVAALDAGAFDYVACPPDSREMDRIMTSALNETRRTTARAAAAG